MLQRVLEPEVMDTEEDAVEYDSMDNSEVNTRFVEELLAAGSLEGEVLDLGTGTGLIPLELCRQHPTARVLGVDLAESMLIRARRHVEEAGLRERVRFERVDAKGLPYGDGSFAVVMSNSIVHHVPEPRTCISEMARVLAADGRVFVRDLMRPVDEATLRSQVDTYAADCSEYQRRLFSDSLRAALDVSEVQALVEEVGFDPATVTASSDRHWTWSGSRA